MARPKNPNGVQAKIEKLIESPCPEELRTTLSHYLDKTSLFKNHIVTSETLSGSERKSREFKPGIDADNLICNVLLLHQILKDTQVVSEVIDGTIDNDYLKKILRKSEDELRKRFEAYAYWIYRISSLKKVLQEKTCNFSEDNLEDALQIEVGGIAISKNDPFILRAVRNLEELEESGRLNNPTAESYAEKAEAMLSLGFLDQADEYAASAIKIDETCSKAWFIRTVVALEGRKRAGNDYFNARLRGEDAEALSSEERWAEEMMEMASNEAELYEQRLREIIPRSILHWPKEPDSPSFNHDSRRIFARDIFVDMMFRAVHPLRSRRNIETKQVYAIHGMLEDYLSEAEDFPWVSNDPPPLAKVSLVEGFERDALEIVFAERDESLSRGFGFYHWNDDAVLIKDLKLLHLRYVTRNSSYVDHLRKFFDLVDQAVSSKFGTMFVFNPWINKIFTTHLVRLYGDDKASDVISDWSKKYESEVQSRGAEIILNRLRALFHHHFVRSNFASCIRVARQALLIPESSSCWIGVQDHTCQDGESRVLDRHFWTYLLVRSAIEEYKVNNSPGEEVIKALLAVERPREYFERDESFCISLEYSDDATIYYIPPYGESLMETSEWKDSLFRACNEGFVGSDMVNLANKIMTNLG